MTACSLPVFGYVLPAGGPADVVFVPRLDSA